MIREGDYMGIIHPMDRREHVATEAARIAHASAMRAYAEAWTDGYMAALTQLETSILSGEDPMRLLCRLLRAPERVA